MKSLHLSELGRRTPAPAISWLMHAALVRPNLISLAAGFTDAESLPVAETRSLFHRLLHPGKTGRAALQYGTTQGDLTLRRLTARNLLRADGAMWRGGAYSHDRMIITSGSQQLLYMTAEALCDTGDIVLVEDPTYFVYLDIMQSRGLKTRGVRLDRDGLNLDHLEEVLISLKRSGGLRRLKMLYLVSYFQNPTGVTTGADKKRAILKLLRQFEPHAGHPIYLFEDAAYRELRFNDPDEPSALALDDSSQRVIYTSTYSKPFATGARVGYGLLPEPVFSAVLRIKGNHDFGTSNLLQQLLARAVSSRIYAGHVARLRERYARKARVMRRALEEHFPAGVEWWEPQGGLYFWARLPRGEPTGLKSKVFRSALKFNVLYVPGELCYAQDPTRRKPNHELRLSFGSATENEIREGIKRLGTVLRKLV